MKHFTFILATVAALGVSVPATAAPVNVNFSFDGVSGTFFGLDDTGSVASPSNATSVFIDGVLGDYNFDIPPTTVSNNDFAFGLGGDLIAVDFTLSQNVDSDTGTSFAADFSVQFVVGQLSTAFLGEVFSDFSDISEVGGPVEFTIVPADTTPPVPLPAGAVLLLTGVAGLSVLRRRRTPDA